jgi:O-succinylbenzoic acid--CoA ligase
MFLRDTKIAITFQELQERAEMFRSNNVATDTATIEVEDTRPAPIAIRASVDLETAASIAYHWFIHHQTILILGTHSSPDPISLSSPDPISLSSPDPSPFTSPLTSILNPQSLILLSTSGTTGKPKWIAYTRGQILAAAAASEAAMRPSAGSSWLLNLPLHHTGGLGILLRSLVWGTNVHISDRRDAEGILKTITDYVDIDTVSMVPTQLHDILLAGGADRLRRLRNILIGAGSLSEYDHELVHRHKLPVRQSYGMTETLGHFCLTERASDQPIGFQSCGRPLAGNELSVVDDQGNALPDGNVGHIFIRGAQVISDYAEPDPSKFENGWFRTGDYGYLTDGEMYFVARRTDMIKSGGENVIAMRVESAVKELPYIVDCAVIGMDDLRWGQRVHACISIQEGAIVDIVSLRNDLRITLLPFELPHSMSIHNAIPRNTMGKLQRELLNV